jgi:DNA-binding Xre family transcriptional regulator
MNFNKIKTIADEKNIPLTKIAMEAGITPQGLHQMLRNEDMKVGTFEKICIALGEPPSVFFINQPPLNERNTVSEPITAYGNMHEGETSLKTKLVLLEADNLKLKNELMAAKDKIIDLLEKLHKAGQNR